MIEWVDSINNILWGDLLTYLLLSTGVYFTFRTGFIQLRRLRYSISCMIQGREKSEEGSVSSFQAFCTSLAARVGTGNMAGVAVAISLGGPGAIFWMWIVSLVGMSTSLVENTLAQIYKTDNHDGTFRGGPAYYMEKALKSRLMGLAFSIFLIISFGFAFNSVQANSIASALQQYQIPPSVVGVTLACVAAFIFFGGIKSIAKFAELVVPIMAIFYLIVAFAVILLNITEIPNVIALIFKSAFGFQSTAAGGVAFAMKTAMDQGVKRGLFSNEAGMGSGPNAAATATPIPDHPAVQGFMGMLGVFTDTIIICTATAAIILLSPDYQTSGLTGIELTQHALTQEVGSWGGYLVTIAILFFAFTSIIANYYYGETSLRFIFEDKAPVFLYRLLVMVIIFIGSVSQLEVVWAFADLSMGLMAVINLASILLLSRYVFKVLKDYEMQLNRGGIPVFDRTHYPFLDKTIDEDVWKS